MWGREMRAGLVFVIAALLIGQGFREWRRGHEESFQGILRSLESRDPGFRGASPPLPGAGSADSVRLEDGAPARGAAGRARHASREVPIGRIDPDRAGVTELTRLPGIGPALAGRIVEDRGQRGPYRSPEGLLRVRGIGPKTLARIRGFLSFSAPAGGDSLTGY